MIATKTLAHLSVAAAAALLLAGCVTVFPKTKPTQLYRFDAAQAAPAATPVAGAAAAVGVLRTLPNFAKAATGDRILTVTGDHVAYVADARWVSPASVLFDEAMTQAFDAAAGPVRLVGRGEPAKADYVLRVDVRNFEATYDVGGRGAPTIVVRANAVLTRTRDHALVDARLFEARVRAGDNRVGAIVQAFGGASGQVLGQLVAWTAEKAPPLPAA